MIFRFKQWILKKFFWDFYFETCLRDEKYKILQENFVKAEEKIRELIDLRRELKVRLDTSDQRMVVQAIVWKDPMLNVGLYEFNPSIEEKMMSRPVQMEIGAGMVHITNDIELRDATQQLKELVADYCGNYVRQKVLERIK